MAITAPTLFTLGHSTRALDEFLELLAESRVECVVDVRRLPGSRAFPQYNGDALCAWLAQVGIDYWHLTALAGLRKAEASSVQAGSPFWTNASFRRYAHYARTEAFNQGVRALEQRARNQRCVLMCAEAVWWRCHRRIIADHLLAHGSTVLHIMGRHQVVPATLTPGAVVSSGELIYPRHVSSAPLPSTARSSA